MLQNPFNRSHLLLPQGSLWFCRYCFIPWDIFFSSSVIMQSSFCSINSFHMDILFYHELYFFVSIEPCAPLTVLSMTSSANCRIDFLFWCASILKSLCNLFGMSIVNRVLGLSIQ